MQWDIHTSVVLFQYHIGKSELETRTLWVTVWHNDTFGRNDFLGEVTVPLDYYEFKDASPKWYQLQERVRRNSHSHHCCTHARSAPYTVHVMVPW